MTDAERDGAPPSDATRTDEDESINRNNRVLFSLIGQKLAQLQSDRKTLWKRINLIDAQIDALFPVMEDIVGCNSNPFSDLPLTQRILLIRTDPHGQ